MQTNEDQDQNLHGAGFQLLTNTQNTVADPSVGTHEAGWVPLLYPGLPALHLSRHVGFSTFVKACAPTHSWILFVFPFGKHQGL